MLFNSTQYKTIKFNSSSSRRPWCNQEPQDQFPCIYFSRTTIKLLKQNKFRPPLLCKDHRHSPTRPSLNVSWLLVSVSLRAPTSNKCVSELSFKREKQHLKLTPTLGSTLRAETVSSEGFFTGKQDSENQQLQVWIVSPGLNWSQLSLCLGELKRVTSNGSWYVWPPRGKLTVTVKVRGGQGGKLKTNG